MGGTWLYAIIWHTIVAGMTPSHPLEGVSRLCLGGNIFGRTMSPAESFDVLDAFVAGGGNFVDTADSFSVWIDGLEGGESETFIG